jgi:hypothetical protein
MIPKKPGAFGVLYERPWNMHVLELPNVTRVRTWTEVPGVLKQIAETKKPTAAL